MIDDVYLEHEWPKLEPSLLVFVLKMRPRLQDPNIASKLIIALNAIQEERKPQRMYLGKFMAILHPKPLAEYLHERCLAFCSRHATVGAESLP